MFPEPVSLAKPRPDRTLKYPTNKYTNLQRPFILLKVKDVQAAVICSANGGETNPVKYSPIFPLDFKSTTL